MKMFKVRHEYNIIFDLDGTLVHTAPALAKAANFLLRELKLPEISTDVYSSFIGGGIKNIISGSSTWNTPGIVAASTNVIVGGNSNLISSVISDISSIES